jgi:4-phytase/acid phosphatase
MLLTLGLGDLSDGASAEPRPKPLVLERAVMLVRHGVRAPLPDEALAPHVSPWPQWSTPGSFLTPHGAEGMRLLGIYDRARYAAMGLLPTQGCPASGDIVIWANAVERTVASGDALAQGLAPGCGVGVAHLPLGRQDPLFAWPGSDLPNFDAAAAVAAITAETGGAAKLAGPYRGAITILQVILGCDAPAAGVAPLAPPCNIAGTPASIAVSADGRGIDLSGPIRITSGTAQVLMLEYVEGLPIDQVGWGRATAERLAEVSTLHGLLFDVYSRPPYMAPRVAGALARRLLAAVDGSGADSGGAAGATAPKLTILVGHDDNIAAITALLGVDFQSAGYGYDDPPIGAALIFEVLRDGATGELYVRTLLQAQTPDQLRDLSRLDLAHPPSIEPLAPAGCVHTDSGLCRLQDFTAMMRRRLAL